MNLKNNLVIQEYVVEKIKSINNSLKRCRDRLIESTLSYYKHYRERLFYLYNKEKVMLPYHGDRLVYLYNAIIKIIFYTKDGSLTWLTRILILTLSGFIAVIFTPIAVGFVASRLIKNIDILTDGNTIFLSSFTILIFGLMFGFGYWIIRTHDVKKQFEDTFKQYNETLLSNAINLAMQEDKFKKAVGLRELTMLKNRNSIEQDRITRIIGNIPFIKKDLAGIDLREVDLSGSNLEGVDLTGAKLQRANLQGVNLDDAILEGADLTNAKVGRLRLQECLTKQHPSKKTIYITQTRFRNAKLSRACLYGVDISFVISAAHDLFGADLYRVNFKGTSLKDINLQKANLTQTNLKNVYMENINLYDANLSRANLENARMKNVNLCNANLTKANLRGVYFEQTTFIGADLRGADFKINSIGIPDTRDQKRVFVLELTNPTHPELANILKNILKDALYNDTTKFHNWFDPEKYEMKRKE